jgi:glycosyltransferase involved in cell wall biosynthesis
MPARGPEPRVILLLSTYNGEKYLDQQLESLLVQTHKNWVLYWRDDGSTDGTVAIMEAFAARAGQGRCVYIDPSRQRCGPTTSFLTLLTAAVEKLAALDAIAFVDQDDVWLPHKLARGLAALKTIPPDEPALYCAPQILVDAALRRIGISGRAPRGGAFPASLTQNIATGCTVMLNRAAAALVARSRPSPSTLHDWWCYLLVTAAGGRLVQDKEPVVLYRQHATNAVGAPASPVRRAIAALRRGPRQFMTVLRQHVAALAAQPELLSPKARDDVASLNRVLNASFIRRLAALTTPGFRRQYPAETMLFRAWFLIG